MHRKEQPGRGGPSRALCPVALLCLMILLISCGAQPTEEHLYAPGETAEVDGWQVTVHSFSIVDGDAWRQPAAGRVFCAVELTLKNGSSQIRFVMPEKQMQLVDADGRNYTIDSEAGVLAARARQWFVPQGEVGPGIESHGAAAYEIPLAGADQDAAEERSLRWEFRSGLFPWSKRIIFELGPLPAP